MSANRMWLWVLLLASIGVAFWYRSAVMSAPESTKSLRTRVVFVTGGSDNFWKLTIKGAEAAARAHNAELRVEMPTHAEQTDEQLKILTDIDPGAVDGCAVSPLDAESETAVLNGLVKSMHLVTFDSDAPRSERQYHIGTSNYQAGKFSGDSLREALPEGGKVCLLISGLSKNNLQERKEGFEKSVRKSLEDADESDATWRIAAILTDEGDVEKAKQNISQALEAHEDVACFVGMNGYHGPILLKVLSKADKLGKIKIIAFDEEPDTLQGILDGNIHATVAQDPFNYGYEAVRLLTALHNNKSSELPSARRGSINVNCEVVRQANVEEFRKRLKKRLSAAEEETTPEQDLPEASANSTS